MKNFFLFFSLFFLLNGCDQLNKDKANIGELEKCMKKNQSELIDKEITRNNCVEKIEKGFPTVYLTGGGNLNSSYGIVDEWTGDLKNESTNIVYTSFSIVVGIYKDFGENLPTGCSDDKNKCQKFEYKFTFKNAWIQPGGSDYYISELKEKDYISKEYDLIKFNMKDIRGSKSGNSNWYWFITDAKGLTINK